MLRPVLFEEGIGGDSDRLPLALTLLPLNDLLMAAQDRLRTFASSISASDLRVMPVDLL